MRKVFVEKFDNNKFFDVNICNFPLDDIEKTYKYNSIDDEYLNELMKYRKDSAEAFAILSLLFPFLDTKNNDFHKDHLHPSNQYGKYEKYMKNQNLEYFDYTLYDSLPNLQLLDANENMSKQDKNLKEWVEENHKDNKVDFMKKYFIPDIDLSIENFNEFYEKRKKLIKDELKNKLSKNRI